MQNSNFKYWVPNKYKNYTQLIVVLLLLVFIALIFMFINNDIGGLLLMVSVIYGVLGCPLIIFVMFTNSDFNNVESNKIYFNSISGMEEILNLSELPPVYEITMVKEVNKITNKKYKITLNYLILNNNSTQTATITLKKRYDNFEDLINCFINLNKK